MAIASWVALVAPGYAGTHVVQRGETFSSIAREYRVSLDALVRANRGVDPDRIHPGLEVIIPEAGGKAGGRSRGARVAERSADRAPAGGTVSHVVKKGESLTAIARRCNTTVEALVRLNGIEDENRLQAGRTILVPAGAQSRTVARREREETTVDLTPPATRREGRSARAGEAAVQGIRYRVQRGETTSTIARKHGITWGELARANRGIDPNHLAPGQIIRVPVRERTLPASPQVAARKAPAPVRERSRAERAADPGVERQTAVRAPSNPGRPVRQPAAVEAEDVDPVGESVPEDYGLAEELADAGTEVMPVGAMDESVRNAVKVGEGDTLESIAAEFGTTEEVLRQLNGFTPFDTRLVPGSFVVIPRQAMRAANIAAHPS